MANENQHKNELVIDRVFEAPRSLVWKAWTDPGHLKLWWGPKDFTAPTCKVELRVGGKYLFCMKSADGQEYWLTGKYTDIIPFEKIVYTDNFADKEGNVVPASYYKMPSDDWPTELNVKIKLEESGNKTKMTLVHTGLPEGDMTEMCKEGWNQSFDKLAESLKLY